MVWVMETRGFGTRSKSVPMGPRQVLLFGAFFLLIGLIAGTIAVVLTLDARSFYATASETDGVVVDIREDWSRDSDGKTRDTYCPIVEFTVDGSRHRFEDNVCTSSNGTSVGDTVTVAYQPGNPDKARILGGWFRRYMGPLITGPLGVIFGGVGVLLMIVRNRAGSAPKSQFQP